MRSTARLGRALLFARANQDLLTTQAMRAEGLSRDQIVQLVDDRVIERIIRGLYRLAGSRSRMQDIAACLLRHRAAAASHVSALFVHDLDVEPPRRPHFTLPDGGAATRLGVAHRSPLLPVDRTVRKGLRVTTLARAIVDSAEVLDVERLAEVTNEAVSRKLVRIPEILEAAARAEAAPGRAGLGRLRSVMASWTDPIEPDSPTEAAAIRRIRSFGLPAPVTQHEVYDEDGTFVARLDMAWPEGRVGREYVSARWHRPDRIEDDELRLQALEALGWTMDNLYRYQLQPNEVAWLRTLATDLAGGRSISA